MSTASTRARGKASAAASAMQPEPVPRSAMRRTAAGSTQGVNWRFDELGDGRARNQHALVDVEAHAGIPARRGQVHRRHALADAPSQQLPIRCRAAVRHRPRAGRDSSSGRRRPQRMRQQRGRIVQRAVRAVTVVQLCARQPQPRALRKQLARRLPARAAAARGCGILAVMSKQTFRPVSGADRAGRGAGRLHCFAPACPGRTARAGGAARTARAARRSPRLH